MKVSTIVSSSVLFAALTSGCRHSASSPPDDHAGLTPATHPSNVQFASPAHGVGFTYPSDWKPTPSDAYVLLITQGVPEPAISLDVPELPAHLPGFIPLGLVVNGYIDDLKKQRPGVAVGKPTEAKIAGATARRVRSQSGLHIEDAVLTVHGDRVYIFRLNASADQESAAAAVFDEIISAVQWK